MIKKLSFYCEDCKTVFNITLGKDIPEDIKKEMEATGIKECPKDYCPICSEKSLMTTIEF